MSCTDISEQGVAVFEKDRGLIRYTLQKGTCGATIEGDRLLKNFFYGKSLEAIACLTWNEIDAVLSPRNLVTNYDERKISYSIWTLCQEYLGMHHLAENMDILLIDVDMKQTLTIVHTIEFTKELPVPSCSTACDDGGCGSK